MRISDWSSDVCYSYLDGAGIGILPGTNPGQANPYVDIAIPTGSDHGRNLVVAQSEAVIAIGGGAGTLSEIAFAWIHRRLIIALSCEDRKSVGEGKGMSGRVDHGGRVSVQKHKV